MRHRNLIVLGSLLFAGCASGGAGDDDVSLDPDASDATSYSEGGDSSSSGGMDALADRSPVQPDSGSGSDATMGPDVVDGSTGPETAPVDAGDSSMAEAGPPEAGMPETGVPETGGGPPTSVPCPLGSATACLLVNSFCCAVNQGNSPSYSCALTGSCTTHGQIYCANTASCPTGQVCCGTEQLLTGLYSTVECSQTCSGSLQYQFCDPAANDCPSGETCVSDVNVPAFYSCQ